MPERIPLHRVLFPEPVTAGMSLKVLADLAELYRTTNEDAEPILVRRQGDIFTITDGRHRAVASMVAGRKTVLAVVHE